MTNSKTIPTIESLTKPGVRKIPKYIAGDSLENVRKKYAVTEMYKLASNENQLGVSPKALEAMRAELENTYIYPDTFCDQLRQKIGERYNLTRHNVVVTGGGSGGIALIGDAFLCPGDEVLYCAPTFTLYKGSAIRASATEVTLPVLPDGSFDLKSMAGAVTEHTKLIYVCSPNNPTGGTVKHDELLEFVDALPPHVITVIDEAYIEFATDPGYSSLADSISDERRMIVMRTFSKAYGLAAARIGYLLSNQEIHANLMRCVTPFIGNRLGLAGASAALDDDDFLEKSVRYVKDGREYLVKEFEELGFRVFPSQANFLYVDTGNDTSDFSEKCKSRGLIIRGNFPYARITVGTRYQNEKMIAIIKEVLKAGVEPRKEKA